ncbi:Cytochrome c-type biogenesis protein CcsB [Desulfamplus magnetovallimortis]|uniref:Heme exporter protein C n=1 Tax=Desulfamplus magnetovallimortis TaxID=1246637 RepID=A0A1W1HJ69_9BACT|nr:c-type cytochrome biogenesis protein CcsB [Desulfamplus magnetovallimortis]SLM32504.1 Cytochrome c-type biogenesis protein CcsB [Desulfamplus magnetovallimortis]
MSSSHLLGITTFAYLLASILYIGMFIFRAKRIGFAATAATVIAVAANTAGIGLRWAESHWMGFGYAPLSNMYESLVFFALSISSVFLWFEYRYGNRFLGAFVVPFSAVAMGLAGLKNPAITPLIPALKSNWLIAHVVTCFIGYAAFAISCGLGSVYLLMLKSNSSSAGRLSRLMSQLPSLDTIDDIIQKTLVFGFFWFTAGIITGAVWANSAWGTYWSWDPKETWSLITWFLYAAALHFRYIMGWGGKRIAWFSIIGFASVMFTYYGVNYLLSGLHSYG